jgi:ATP-dependent RNA helicase MSS116
MPLEKMNMNDVPGYSPGLHQVLSEVSLDQDMTKAAAQAYIAWLGFYNTNTRKCGFNKAQLVQVANEFAQIIGCSHTPSIEKRTIGKMGLKNVPGLNIA